MKTPQQSYPLLAEALGVPDVYLKREDLHPYGSHKGRSIPVMMKEYLKKKHTHFVISSSGNAAIASAVFVKKYNQNNSKEKIKLDIYIGKRIAKDKYERLHALVSADSYMQLLIVERPKQEALWVAKNANLIYLRQSIDDLALLGYRELAEELLKLEDISAVFIPTSSGTTAQALGEIFSVSPHKLQIHIVQTEYCHPMVENASEERKSIGSLASAIVDQVARRKEKVMALVKQTGGSGWIATDDDIREAMDLVKKTCNLAISPNSALSIVGLKKASEAGCILPGPAVCLVTGP